MEIIDFLSFVDTFILLLKGGIREWFHVPFTRS